MRYYYQPLVSKFGHVTHLDENLGQVYFRVRRGEITLNTTCVDKAWTECLPPLYFSAKIGNFALATQLIKKGMPPDDQTGSKTTFLLTLFKSWLDIIDVCEDADYEEFVELLEVAIAHNAELNTVDDGGKTILDIAVAREQGEVASILSTAGALPASLAKDNTQPAKRLRTQ